MGPESVEDTAKLVFSRDAQGRLQALVIPFTEDGSFPRSGWILCTLEDPVLPDARVPEPGEANRSEGYFRVRYRVVGQDDSSPVLQYRGVIEQLEAWHPNFLSNDR
jgi:hypothetical protein